MYEVKIYYFLGLDLIRVSEKKSAGSVCYSQTDSVAKERDVGKRCQILADHEESHAKEKIEDSWYLNYAWYLNWVPAF